MTPFCLVPFYQSLSIAGRETSICGLSQCAEGLSVTALFWITKCPQVLGETPEGLDSLPSPQQP